MYFKKKEDIIYRDFGEFGYITDNRNYGYTWIDDYKCFIGDKILSKSGSLFYSVLSKDPLTIEEIVDILCLHYDEVDKDALFEDALDFFKMLVNEGFVVGGESLQECYEKEKFFSYVESADDSRNKKRNLFDDNSTQTYFSNYFGDKHQLTSILVEITSICNERCIHCYIPEDLKCDVMKLEQFNEIIKQAREMNVLHITISGGEPMLHPEFIQILKICKEYNFSVNILSNLTLLNDEIFDEMTRNKLLCVQTSIYSMNEIIHDEITQKKGSLLRTLDAVQKLVDHGIPVQISCPIMKQNRNCYEEVIKWGNKRKINVNSDFVIIGQYDHCNENLNCRLLFEDINQIIKTKIEKDKEYVNAINDTIKKKREMNPEDNICSVCHVSVCISEKGDVYPCAGWKGYTLGNINDNTLENIWEKSEKIKYLRKLKGKDFVKCLDCSDKYFCSMCMVRNSNEHPLGNPLEPSPFYCKVANATKKIYSEIISTDY